MQKSILIKFLLRKELVKITPPLNPFLNIILISIILLLVNYQTAYSQNDEESTMEKGIAAIFDSQFEEAIVYFDKILERDPQNIKALNNKGVALGELKRHSEAIYQFDKVLEIDPNNVSALNNKGIALVKLGKYDDALSYFDRVLAIDPQNQSAKYSKKIILNRDFSSLMGKGIAAIFDSQFEEAIVYFDKILERDPQNIKVLSNKGVALGELKRHSEAIYQFDKVLEIDPNNADALNNIGAVLINEALYDDALSYFDKVLAIDPEDQVAKYSKKNIMTAQILAESFMVERVKTLAVFVQLSIRDSNDNLVNYIESERILVMALSSFIDFIDDINSGKLIDDPSINDATYYVTKKNVTKSGQDLELVTIRYQGVYNGPALTISKTVLSPNTIWGLVANHDGYPIRHGEYFDVLWSILRPIS